MTKSYVIPNKILCCPQFLFSVTPHYNHFKKCQQIGTSFSELIVYFNTFKFFQDGWSGKISLWLLSLKPLKYWQKIFSRLVPILEYQFQNFSYLFYSKNARSKNSRRFFKTKKGYLALKRPHLNVIHVRLALDSKCQQRSDVELNLYLPHI